MRESAVSIAQGDLWFRRIETLPEGLSAKTTKGGTFALAQSSTNSGDHEVSVESVTLYPTTKPRLSYIVLKTEFADIVHLRPSDTHETARLLGGVGAVWEVRRPREMTPSGWQTVAD